MSPEPMPAVLEGTVILGARWKAALTILGSAAFVAAGVWMAQGSVPEVALIAWASILFFGLCLFAGIGQFLWPTRLRLVKAAFIIEAFPWRRRVVSWEDVDEFFLWRHQSTKVVAFNYHPGRAPSGFLVQANRAFGLEGALPTGLRISPERLLELMCRWKEQVR